MAFRPPPLPPSSSVSSSVSFSSRPPAHALPLPNHSVACIWPVTVGRKSLENHLSTWLAPPQAAPLEETEVASKYKQYQGNLQQSSIKYFYNNSLQGLHCSVTLCYCGSEKYLVIIFLWTVEFLIFLNSLFLELKYNYINAPHLLRYVASFSFNICVCVCVLFSLHFFSFLSPPSIPPVHLPSPLKLRKGSFMLATLVLGA